MVNVFITGASSLVGSHLTSFLIAAGHKITAIAKSDSALKKLQDQGINVIRADAVIQLRFEGHTVPYPCLYTQLTNPVITATAQALRGINKSLIIISSVPFTGLPYSTELSPGSLPPRTEAERFTLSLCASGICSHVGATHVEDVVEVYKLAFESKSLKGGEVLHACHESGILFKSIAITVAKRLGVEARSMDKEDAEKMYNSPLLALFMNMDLAASSELTREWLGWKPERTGLIRDIEESEWYFC
ncbi:hypothetical protein IAR50_001657 [Cryptococcus sp. DSM 104548]